MINLAQLNPQQREAVEAIHGPVLVLAGAGTGKTRVLTFRLAHMIHQGIRPATILGVTFTNKAAREMQERIRQLLPKTPANDGGQRPTLGTFHSFCARVLRSHIGCLGYKPNFVIFDESDQLGIVRKILSRTVSGKEKVDPSQALSLISRLRNRANRGCAGPGGEDPERAEQLCRMYESALRACNAVDFDDLILLTLKLLREHPQVRERLQHDYRYVMVDEYQDTNGVQFELIHALAGTHRNLFVVGDDDQSIYGWRGAEAANMLRLEEHFPGVRIIRLEKNYRSTNNILEAANALITHNVRRHRKRLWSDRGTGPLITLTAYDNEEEEASGVVDAIEFRRLGQQVGWGDQAILMRTNAQARPFEAALRRAGVRYRLVGGQSYFDRREIRDVLAYLRLMVNPDDDIDLLRVANVPARGLSDGVMQQLLSASHENGLSVFAAMQEPTVLAAFPLRAQNAIGDFVRMVQRNRQRLTQSNAASVSAWAQQLLAEIHYLDDLRRSEKDPESAENRVRNVSELLSGLDADRLEGASPEARIESFLEGLALTEERDEEEPAPGGVVTLITIHSCKGLEYPHVHVVGIEDGLLPHTRSKEEGTLDEERRLFYVAMTRAMNSLHLSWCQGRKRYGQTSPCHASPFLKEIPQHLTESQTPRSQRRVAVTEGKKLFDSIRASLG